MNMPTRFFLVATLYALCGMVWGIMMSASHDYTMAPAHGHLNLLGFVAMAIWGAYYALTPHAAETGLAKVHFWLSTASVAVVVPGIAMALTQRGEVLAQIGSLALLANMILFAFIVLRHGAGASQTPLRGRPQPAE